MESGNGMKDGNGKEKRNTLHKIENLINFCTPLEM
jgi:hypothetical protein